MRSICSGVAILLCVLVAVPGSYAQSQHVASQAALDAAIPAAAERGVGIILRQVFASGLVTRQLDALRLDELDGDSEVAARKRDQLVAYAEIVERCGRSRA